MQESYSIVPLDGTYRRLLALQSELGLALASATAGGTHLRDECIPALERQILQSWGVPFVLATSSGYASLCLALYSAGVQPGQEVIVPALAQPWTLLAIHSLGATPHIVDIDETLTICPLAAQEAIVQGNAAALLAPYPFGLPPDMRALMGLSAEYGIPVIEEVTGAPGARWSRGRYAGIPAGQIGHCGLLSLSYGEPLCGLWSAGLLLCRDEVQSDMLLELRGQWDGRDTSGSAQFLKRHHLRELDALCLQLEVTHLPDWQRRQSAITARYVEAFADLDAALISPPFADWENGATCFPVVTRSAQSRHGLASYLARRGIQTGEGRLLRLPDYATREYRTHTGLLKSFDTVAPALLLLPCHAELADAEVERVINSVQLWHMLERCA
jgi:dTDP-4-amino-4,6-dideoxygalactose transaminase